MAVADDGMVHSGRREVAVVGMHEVVADELAGRVGSSRQEAAAAAMCEVVADEVAGRDGSRSSY